MLKIDSRGRMLLVALASVLTLLFAQTPAIAAASQADRDRVQWRAMSDGRWEVRSAAAVALNDTRDPDAVTKFLKTGLNAAINRAAAFERANIAEISYWRRISPTSSAVYIGCTRALSATHDEKDEFVRTGLAIARELDESGEHPDEEVAKQAREDRDFVASLAETDPGLHVQQAAATAIEGGTDADIADFFKYYWVAGARLDDEAYKLAIGDLDLKGNAALVRLRQIALTAEAAEAGASGEAAEKLHAETVAAWHAVATAATGTSENWAAERDRAARQAEKWAVVAEYARGATTGQDWAAVLARAGDNATAWQDAVRWAEQQATEWAELAAEMDER